VTALFCDIAESTALGERLDPEALHGVITRYLDEISQAVERHGGTVQKFAGDAVLAVFGVPRVNEDDALRAVRAAAEIRARLPAVAEELRLTLRVRTGVNTGLVMTDEGRSGALGDAVNVAARLEQAAEPGEILLGAETLRLVRDAVEVEPLEPLTMKGKSEPVLAFRLLTVDPVAPGVSRPHDVPLVGREGELRFLLEQWEQPGCKLVTVLGIAGVGKSRLVAELVARAGDSATVLRGRCLHYGEGITFWPIVEALTPLGERGRPVLEHVSKGGLATPEELFLEVRRLLESIAAERPLILQVDDLQWAEPMMVQLIDHVVELSRGPSILVVCTARLELLEQHPGWSAEKRNATVIRLSRLSGPECEMLLDRLGHGLEPDTREKVVRTSEGNPLFLQEMAVLARESGEVEVPPSIQALLAARLEQLDPRERDLLERAAVEGELFHRSAVYALSGAGGSADVDPPLAALIEKDLIRPAPGNVVGDEAYRFRHLLIRDAAYERLPKATRARLHERYAQWLEHTAVDFAEVDEIAGWHLEQAVRHERELRHPVDRAVAAAAAQHLLAAARRAGNRSDAAAACTLLERAHALAEIEDRLHDEIRVELAERLIELGDLSRSDEVLAEVERSGAGLAAALNRLEWLVLARPEEAAERIESDLPPMLDSLARTGDERGIARAHWVAFWVQWTSSRAEGAAERAKLAAEHARVAGDDGLRARALGWYAVTLIYGPHHRDRMTAELDAIESGQMGPYLAAFVDVTRGEVQRLAGDTAEARRLLARAGSAFAALGMQIIVAAVRQALGRIELAAGDPRAARRELLRSDAMLAEFGERPFRSTTQAMLARVHLVLGEADAAAGAADRAEELSAAHDVVNFAITHEVRARLALAGGDVGAAERWARSAVRFALQTDFVEYQAEARLALAVVLDAAGSDEQAGAEARAALALFDAKGSVPGGESARRQLLRMDSSC
jgi:class 3 adenylate cyclase